MCKLVYSYASVLGSMQFLLYTVYCIFDVHTYVLFSLPLLQHKHCSLAGCLVVCVRPEEPTLVSLVVYGYLFQVKLSSFSSISLILCRYQCPVACNTAFFFFFSHPYLVYLALLYVHRHFLSIVTLSLSLFGIVLNSSFSLVSYSYFRLLRNQLSRHINVTVVTLHT